MVDTGGNHANLTGEYAAIPAEMKRVAGFSGKEYSRDVEEQEFYDKLPAVRGEAGDRAVLRAMHFFDDDRLAKEEAEALKAGDFDGFKQKILESGRSSFQRLQNVFLLGVLHKNRASVAFALSRAFLGRQGGAFRCTAAVLPERFRLCTLDLLEEYRTNMEKVFGEGSCYVLSVRSAGGTKVELS